MLPQDLYASLQREFMGSDAKESAHSVGDAEWVAFVRILNGILGNLPHFEGFLKFLTKIGFLRR